MGNERENELGNELENCFSVVLHCVRLQLPGGFLEQIFLEGLDIEIFVF